MVRSSWPAVVGMLALVAFHGSVGGQAPGVNATLSGRVEDAVTRAPLESVRVFLTDSSASVLTNSAGEFTIRAPLGSGPAVYAERLGYVTERFELDGDPRTQRFVLVMRPAPISIEGITAEVEAARTELERNLENRRRSYPGAVRSMDESWLVRFGPSGGSAWDVVRQAAPAVSDCRADSSQVCVPGRSRTFRNPYPERRLLVCVDGWKSVAPVSELSGLPMEAVSLVEVFQRRQVRVYTEVWMRAQSEIGLTTVMPLDNDQC